MSEIAKILADNLRRLRKEKNLTQTELAEAVDVSLTAIQGYESERTWPSTDTIKELAKSFKVKESELFKDPNNIEPIGASLQQFARLLSNANPIAIEHALRLLAEVGQSRDESVASPEHRRRTAKT